MKPSTTIVVPVFNEARRLQPEAFLTALDQQPTLSIRFVDDGSTDETPDTLAALSAAGGGRISLQRLRSNAGKGEAVRQGLLAALATEVTYLGYWDADLATPLEELPAFIDALENNDELTAVLGSRVRLLGRHIQRRAIRHYLGRVFATAASAVLSIPVYDTQCGAKVFRKTEVFARCLASPFRSRWIFDVELLARLSENLSSSLEAHAMEIPVSRWADVGASKLRLSDWTRAPIELLALWAGPRWANRRGDHDRT